MGKTIIVGGHGFIGSHLYNYLTSIERDVEKLPKEMDITNDDFEISSEGPIDYIYHLATRCTNEAIVNQLHDVIDAITIGTMNLLFEAKRLNATLVFVSSMGAVESQAPGAQGAYNGAKRAMEEYVLRYQGVDGKVIRLPRVYGKGMKENHFVYQLWRNIKEGKQIQPQEPKTQIIIAPISTVVEDIVELAESPTTTFTNARAEVISIEGLIRKIYSGRLHGME